MHRCRRRVLRVYFRPATVPNSLSIALGMSEGGALPVFTVIFSNRHGKMRQVRNWGLTEITSEASANTARELPRGFTAS